MNPTHNLFQNNYPQNCLYHCILGVCFWIWSSCSGCTSWGHALWRGSTRVSLSLRKGDQAQLEWPGAQLPPWPQESPSGRLDWELGDMEFIPPDHSQATGLPRNGSDCFERRGCLVMRNREARSIGHCSEILTKGTQQGVKRLDQTASEFLSNWMFPILAILFNSS